VPGETVDLDIEMHFTSWVFAPGHRIRLAVNNSQWPMFWPTPYAMTTTLELGGDSGKGSRLVLPIPEFVAGKVPVFTPLTGTEDPEPEGYGGSTAETESGYAEIVEVTHNFRSGTTRLNATNSGGTVYPWGKDHYSDFLEHSVDVNHPARASVRSEYSNSVEVEGRVLKWTGLMEFRSDETNFYYRYTRLLQQDGETIREKHWDEVIPRDFN
jgi:hypothetical protein